MEITESSSPKSKLFCPVRKEWVSALPEERIRVSLLHYMTQKLDYPAHLLVVEKALHQFPHLAQRKISSLPKRRADLVCYAPNVHPSHPLYPLLLVECKAIPLQPAAIQQLTGYNHYLQAHFVALCNGTEMRAGYFDASQGGYVFSETLPSYNQLLKILAARRSL